MIKSNNRTHLKLGTNKLQKHEQEHNKMSLVQSFKGYITNISYGFEGLKLPFFKKTITKSVEIVPDLYLGGKRFQTVQQCTKAHRQLIWFTYKKNFKISLRYHSDIGWGCLIRVGQMVMAEALRRYLSQTVGNVSYSYIITPFLQSQTNAKYNITKFITKAEILYGKRPGEWFSITQVATILQDLHQRHPLKCSENLKVSVCIQSINIKKLSQIMEGQPLRNDNSDLSLSRFTKREPKKFYLQVTKSHNYYPTIKKRHILLMLIVKLGHTQVPIKVYNSLLQFMKLPMFIGCLGGIPNKARFLTGIYDDKISYLDPHYVEDKVERINLENQLDKFSCKDYRLMSRQELDPNLGLCFYLKNQEEINRLTKCIDLMNSCEKRPYIRYERDNILSTQFQVFREQKQQYKRKLAHDESFSDLNSSRSMQSSFVMD